ncbi:MAG: hypothetical protein IT281_02165 [Ignavibacteria bacterium]|nr:hypothetical protein [Ignavibacteria bacterium]MCC7158323.1 hypothetical protein [Ignavibacteria bacterium]
MIKVMFEYMIEMDLPVPFTDEFLALVPRQRAMVNKLMNEGVITSYALSIEEGRLWIMAIGESEVHINDLLRDFPIAPMVKYKISKLTFHNSISFQIPNFSLN